MTEPGSSRLVKKLVGIYDAKGSLPGELAYWIGARFGVRHCALCEITHGLVRPKEEWRRQLENLEVDFTAVHLDERDPAVEAASRGKEPCVVAVMDDGSAEVVIDREQLESCEGDPGRFAELLKDLVGVRQTFS